MGLLLQQDFPQEFVIATGQTHFLESFVSIAFSSFHLDWRQYVEQNPVFFRPNDLMVSRADPSKIEGKLWWKACYGLIEGIKRMIGLHMG